MSATDAYWMLRRSQGISFIPGLMKMPIVTGISPLWIRLSNTVGARTRPSGST